MGLLDDTGRLRPAGIKPSADESIIVQDGDRLPADTLIHLGDDSFMTSERAYRGFAILTRSPIAFPLKLIELKIGATVLLRGKLEPVGDGDGRTGLHKEQIQVLKEMQALVFGAINVRQMVVASSQLETDSESDDEGSTSGQPEAPKVPIPDDKQLVYFVGLVHRADRAYRDPDLFSLEGTLRAYQQFMASVGSTIGSQMSERRADVQTFPWALDWALMGRLVDLRQRVNLLDHLSALRRFEQEQAAAFAQLGPPPVFTHANDPSGQALVMDFVQFALRRFVVHVPYNGMFYRARCVEGTLNAQSPFESKTVPDGTTYADYVRLKYGLGVAHAAEPLVQVKRVENFASLSKWLLDKAKAYSCKRQVRPSRTEQVKSYLIPELAELLPLPYALLRMAVLLPRAVHDVERQLLIHDFYRTRLPACLGGRVRLELPGSTLMVDSLTAPTAALAYDLERLEILGDSLLKLLASIDVFLGCPSSGEGTLSNRRQDMVCNATLYKVATALDVHRYARLTPFLAKLWCPPDLAALCGGGLRAKYPFVGQLFDGGQRRWELVAQADERAGKRSALFHLYPGGQLVDRRKRGDHLVPTSVPKRLRHRTIPAATPALSRFGHTIPPKVLADLVEAIIGAVYYCGGYEGGVALLRGLGVLSDTMLTYRQAEPAQALGRILGDADARAPGPAAASRIVTPAGSQKLSDVPAYVPDEAAFPYAEVEALLGHRFACRRLLFVAMTHSSVDTAHSNERLEWLGDAALDWVTTKYFYETYRDERWMTPARITVCRQAAVCNEAFSRIAVHSGLHRFLRIDAPFLQLEIGQYAQAVASVESGPDASDPEGPLSALSWNTRYTSQAAAAPAQPAIPPAPKALGDLFEAVAGALCIDLHFDMEAFAQVCLPLTRWYLDRHADPYDLPENPISDFWHDYLAAGIPPSAIEFRYCEPEEVQRRLALQPEREGAGSALPEKASTTTCQILVRGRLVAEATAPTRHLARKFATRQAVIYIRSTGWRDFVS